MSPRAPAEAAEPKQREPARPADLAANHPPDAAGGVPMLAAASAALGGPALQRKLLARRHASAVVQRKGDAGAKEAGGAAKDAPGEGARFRPVDEAAVKVGLSTFGLITDFQAGRIRPAVERLDDGDLLALRALLAAAGSDPERALVLKALAASHTVTELGPFAAAIAGQSVSWLLEHCTTGDSQMTGGGTKQAYSHSCGPTVVQTLHGEVDPIYALKLHTENANINQVDPDDPKKFNPKAAEEQRRMLESTYLGSTEVAHQGKAAAVNEASSGSGRWVNDWLDKLQEATGMTFATIKDPSGPEAVALLDRYVGAGMMTPVVIGNSPGDYAHYQLVMHERKVPRPAVPAGGAKGEAAGAGAGAAGPGAAPAKAHPTLRVGSQGTDVVEAQVKLKNKGYAKDPVEGELQADGYFGPKTRTIVKLFQFEKGLVDDGVIGPKTWAALDLGGYTGADGKTDPKQQREFQFHEVGAGTTLWIPEDDIAQGVMSGPGYATVTGVEVPSAAPPPKKSKK